MDVVILNGADRARDPCDALAGFLEARLLSNGAHVRHYVLRDLAVGHCLGEFDCWVRTPGRCWIKDAGQEIERAVHDTDVLAMVSPVLFGAYGPQLKKGVDRLIPLILPFFARRHGLTHHQYRYDDLPRTVALGVDLTPSAERAALFAAFVESQALNMGSPGWRASVFGATALPEGGAIDEALQPGAPPGNPSGAPQATRAYLETMLTADAAQASPWTSAPRVAILQASAREPGTSTSQSIADYLAAAFRRQGATVEVVAATRFAREPATAAVAAQTLAHADVLVVTAPLYVDALPYLALLALQQAHALRGPGAPPQGVVGVLNCGFPEPEHLRFAFASLRGYARDAGALWAGGLALGGGQVIHGRPLEAVGRVAQPLRRALEQAAEALAQGGVIPPDVSLGSAVPMMPPLLYRFAGNMQWTFGAHAHGMKTADLRAVPFDVMSDDAWEREAAAGSVRARPLRVVGKSSETGDAVTLHFEDPAHDPLHYEAGQYITLDLLIAGGRVRRAYSLASAPHEPGLAITVKRVPGGLMSNHIHDALQPGDIVRSHGPSGHFVAGATARLLMFGGGSGIVPLAAVARQQLRARPDAHITLVYGASTKWRAIYADALDALAEREPDRFHLHWVVEEPPPAWTGPVGRLDEAALGPLLGTLAAAAFDRVMICGPDPMRASVLAYLQARGFDSARCIEESFTSPRAAAGSDRAETATLIPGEGAPRSFTVAPGQSLLEAALDAGEAISFSCMSGGCGACRVTLVEGLDRVALDEPNDVSAADRAAGCVPSCILRVAGPVSFRTG
jgi:ferredoxin-NADP reductase/NAD(P)H-dependent FMN reductase